MEASTQGCAVGIWEKGAMAVSEQVKPAFMVADICLSLSRELEDDLDLAERYLISAMFDDAATTAASILRRLTKRSVRETKKIEERAPCPMECSSRHKAKACELDEIESTEAGRAGEENGRCSGSSSVESVEDGEDTFGLTNSAGTVLIQAYHEMNRHMELIDLMQELFGSTAHVPGELLLMWVALQLSTHEVGLARNTLLEYLAAAKVSKSQKVLNDYTSSTEAVCLGSNLNEGNAIDFDSSSGEASDALWHRQAHLAAAAEIYAVDVLGKGYKDGNAALSWLAVQEWLSPEEKQKINRRIQLDIREMKLPYSSDQTLGPEEGFSSSYAMSQTQKATLQESFKDAAYAIPISKLHDEFGQSMSSFRQNADRETKGKGRTRKTSVSEITEADILPSETEELSHGGEPHLLDEGKEGVAEVQGNEGRKWPLSLVLVAAWLQRHFTKTRGYLVDNGKLTETALHNSWDHVLRHKRAVFVAIFSSLVTFSAIRERAVLRRMWVTFARALRQGIIDLCHLAFTVNLNPLASLQPLPSAMASQMLRY